MNNENRIAAYDISLDEVVRAGGYYDRFGIWNSIVKIDGRLLRGRVEVFIFKDDKIFAADAKNGLLRVPGGSFTKGISNETQCYLEAKEEARILIKNVEYSGYHYIRIYDKIYTSHEKNFIPCEGTYNEVYIAEYDSQYNGFIKPIDADNNMYKTGKWYSIEELYVKLPPNQQKFLEMKFSDKVSNLPKKSEVVKEEVADSIDITTVENKDNHAKMLAIELLRKTIATLDAYKNSRLSIEYYSVKDKITNDDLYIGSYSFTTDNEYDILREFLSTVNKELADKIDYFIPIPEYSSKSGLLRVSKMDDMGYYDLLKNENTLFPYYLPNEMEKIGVFNQGHNFYAESVMDDESIKIMMNYKENVFTGVDQNWYDILMVRYNEYEKDPTDYNRQRLLDLGWNPEIAVTPENIAKVSNNTKKRLASNKCIDITNIIKGEENMLEYCNLILNGKDLEINLDKFESGEENVLLITGLSGSGKSTLAEKLSSKYKCTYYELDCLTFYMKGLLTKEDAIGGEEGLLAFIESKNLKPDKNISYKTGAALYREYIEFIINWCKRQKNKKFIIEGLQIYEVYEDGDTFITSCPIIIKGTSGLVSSIRAAKRNDGSFFKEFGPLLKWVLQDVKYIEKLRKAVSESYIEEAKASYSDSFDDVMDIVDTLPKNELKYICNGSFKNSPYVIYREVLKVNNIPVAFIEIYRFDKGNIGTIVLASRHGHGNKYRRKGYTSEILKRAIEWAHQDNTINKLVYPVKLDNSKSMNLAHKFGFSHPEEDTCPDDKIELELIIDSDLYESYIDQDTISNRDKALEMKTFYEGYASDEVILQEMKRSILPDEVFGIPELRKYPMPDKKHVLSAIRFFNHVDYKYERQLAKRIIINMKKYNIDGSHVGKDNRLRKYLPKDMKDLAVKEIYEDDVHEDFLSQKSKPAKNQRVHVRYLKNKRKRHINNKPTAVNTLSGNNSPSFQFQNSAAILHDDLFNYLIESENTKERKRPIFIVTSWTNTVFGKIISKWTKSTYTHAAIAFDTKLDKLYSYNADNKINKLGGFSVESIDEYRNIYEDSQICVSTFFVKESDFHKIKEGLDRLENNLKKTKYDFINILNIFFNRAVEVGAKGQEVLSLVCSEFVAWLISLADINIVDKPINLITPKDLSNFNNLKIYKLYEGYVRNYDKNKIDRIFNNLKKTANVIKESMIIEYMEMKKK